MTGVWVTGMELRPYYKITPATPTTLATLRRSLQYDQGHKGTMDRPLRQLEYPGSFVHVHNLVPTSPGLPGISVEMCMRGI